MLGPGGTAPQCYPPFLISSIVISLSHCCLANDEGPGPQIFFSQKRYCPNVKVWPLGHIVITFKAQVASDIQWYGHWIVETFKQFLIWPLSQFISRSYCPASKWMEGQQGHVPPISGGQTGLGGKFFSLKFWGLKMRTLVHCLAHLNLIL